jgi:hypothetical protein
VPAGKDFSIRLSIVHKFSAYKRKPEKTSPFFAVPKLRSGLGTAGPPPVLS